MAEIKRVYRQALPTMKLVGRRYTEKDRSHGTFADKWNEWFENHLFEPLQLSAAEREPFEDCDAYIGLCRCKEGEPFEYWIGVFMPPEATVPEGYDSVNLDAGDVAVCWVYGREPEIYTHCCLNRLEEEGLAWVADKNAVKWCFERYSPSRFMPDETGNMILDRCFYVK